MTEKQQDPAEPGDGMSEALAGELAEIAAQREAAAPEMARQGLESASAQVLATIEIMLARIEAALARPEVARESDADWLSELLEDLGEMSATTARLTWAQGFLERAYERLWARVNAYREIFGLTLWGPEDGPAFIRSYPVIEWPERFERISGAGQRSDEDLPF